MADVYHDGERSVQERAGVRASAAKLGPRMIQSELDYDFAAFLIAQPFAVLAAGDRGGNVWATALVGAPGFMTPLTPQRVAVDWRPDHDDPLAPTLTAGPTAVGLVVLEPMSRSRIRLNGTLTPQAAGFELELAEVFGNCPKYIQRRHPVSAALPGQPGPVRSGERLDQGQRALVAVADTFFIASRQRDRGMDASHRGGAPGFVAVSDDGATLTFPDYAGNNMFQTLGNLTVDPAAGLLFIDWSSGLSLQLSGQAEIIWDEPRISDWPGAQRLVDVSLEKVVQRASGERLTWELVEAHRLNPPAPGTT